MSDAILAQVESKYIKPKPAKIGIGDTVDVHVRIIEGSKERIQIFNGVVIKMQGGGVTQTVTVRRIVANEGVERTFLVHSPRIAKIEVKRSGHVRRAKLYYLRDRIGKSRRLRDKRRGLAHATVVKSTQSKAEKAEQKAAKNAEAQAAAEENAAAEAAPAE